ncbi:hypothetical protein G4Z16_00520 [Streptomyces bathyalis]|uniref:Uncharacterized protein n=1 Tax=Streptomyces bathyalis TaxID=2710756 RepID=A0A7T1WQC2_9ACTN|nr:hypothetical protein [Streptomyces bathyalis]QPP05124.1 hypothetical protein G4Z16_00520 [Streptomyces bathyalis]
MDPHGPIAQRFPLVARFRPACLPLPERIASITDLADTAVSESDQGVASSVYNQAALVASDLGRPDLAREMCQQHAAAHLHACPLPGMSAIRALEPAVNLARLQVRAGCGDEGRRRLLALHSAVGAGTAARFEDIAIPASLTATADDRQEVHAWLWRVLLADGTRTLTTEGRWEEALAHIEQHRGIGTRMLDGRQVAVLAALTTGDTARARNLLDQTTPGDPWEQRVSACLTVLCRLAVGESTGQHVADLADVYLDAPAGHGTTVFDMRLGLTILAAARSAGHAVAHDLVDSLHRRTTEARDGYAAREALADTQFTDLASDQQVHECHELLHMCALGSGHLPDDLLSDLLSAIRTGDRVIREGHPALHGGR